MINVSIVLYNNPTAEVERLLDSLFACKGYELINKIYLLDNSEKDNLKYLSQYGSKIIYWHSTSNLGYGTAHNVAMHKSIRNDIDYHLVVNPDICFTDDVLSELFMYMTNNQDVGLVMPKVCYPDGKIQPLCRTIPNPSYLFARRFLPVKWTAKIFKADSLQDFNYDQVANVPCLSGCFMFLRVDSLKKIGGFDERFFMYLEDFDLVRRIHANYKTIYYPHVIVNHDFKKQSYKNIKLLLWHISSAIKYYNKHGWIFDKQRTELNYKFLSSLHE